jgi:hypothetical protein
MRAAESHQGDEMLPGSLDHIRYLIADRLPWHAREFCRSAVGRLGECFWRLCENHYDRSLIVDWDGCERGEEASGLPRFNLRH